VGISASRDATYKNLLNLKGREKISQLASSSMAQIADPEPPYEIDSSIEYGRFAAPSPGLT
jgi:hypothetical protein